MDLEHRNKGHLSSSDSSDLIRPNQPSKLTNLFDRAHTPATLIFIATILEILLGVGVVFASVAGFIEPLWFANFMCLVASLATMIGIYLLFTMIHTDKSGDQLVRDATRRIMNDQN